MATRPQRTHRSSETDRLRRLLTIVVLACPLIALLAGVWYVQTHRNLPGEVVIATGSPGGTYHPLGAGMARLIDDELGDVSATAIQTSGSTRNVELLTAGEVHIAFVQNDAYGHESLRTVARLYDEILQIVVRADAEITTVADLADKTVNLGTADSGTHKLAVGVLLHFGLEDGDFQPRHLSTSEAVDAFQAGRVDAVAILAGLSTPAVKTLLATGDARLLPLGRPELIGSSLEGLGFDLPGTKPAVVPARTYGAQPSRPVGTIAVEALLVARADEPDLLIHRVTRLLFENRFRLSEVHPAAAQMTEIQDAKGLRFPLHPGAASYYARNEPPFFVVYAEALSLGITLAITLGSGFLALRQWIRRTKKNRIDAYYLDLEEIAGKLADEPSNEELTSLKRQLVELRRRAFRDLVSERLEANESFSIFQSALNHRLDDVSKTLVAQRALQPG